MTAAGQDWDPAAYCRFGDLRLRPALDLLARVGDLPGGGIADLGCGSGAVGPVLRARWPDGALTGIDTSPAMLEAAKGAGTYDRLDAGDAAAWVPREPVALIFSNAALHWLADHAGLMPRLAGLIAPGGWLAVQMPRQYGAPSHRFLRDIAADMFPGRFGDGSAAPPVAAPADCHRMLSPLGEPDVWETDYIQRLGPVPDKHPVRAFTEATAMRPFLDRMDPEERPAFTARYEAALASAFPEEGDGSVLFPFRRLFFTLRVPG
ncbi:MAG: methyltransferase domain-containing protein [Paracoccaceae bacterium]